MQAVVDSPSIFSYFPFRVIRVDWPVAISCHILVIVCAFVPLERDGLSQIFNGIFEPIDFPLYPIHFTIVMAIQWMIMSISIF